MGTNKSYFAVGKQIDINTLWLLIGNKDILTQTYLERKIRNVI